MRKPSGPRPIADLVSSCLGPAMAERGFASAEIVSRWTIIAGPQIAPHTRPLRLQWPRRGPATDPERGAGGAVLHLKVASGFALELQYAVPALLDRINAHLGWGCVAQIRFQQGPIGQTAASAAHRPAPLAPEREAQIAGATAPLEEPLAGKMRRLGAAVLGRADVTRA